MLQRRNKLDGVTVGNRTARLVTTHRAGGSRDRHDPRTRSFIISWFASSDDTVRAALPGRLPCAPASWFRVPWTRHI